MSHIHVGRQPIFDATLNVIGYELLYRGEPGQSWPGPDQMTSTVLVNSLLEIGLADLVGDKLAFLNVTRTFIVGDAILPVSPERTVLEILEHVQPDDEVIDACRRLRRRGYRLALDDFVLTEESERFLQVADIVKIDLLAMSAAEVETLAAHCQQYPVQLVAEKVETMEQLQMCAQLGFDLFQGYLLSRPLTLSQRSVEPGRLACLHLLGKLVSPDVDVAEIERIVRTDVGLSYRILRVAGSGAANGMARRIRSLREAVVLLGQRRLRRWVMLMLLADASNTPMEQVVIALARARMAEQLGALLPGVGADTGFTVGLLSALDLLLDTPIGRAVEPLPLGEDMRAAVCHHTGPLGPLVNCVLAHESGNPPAAPVLGLDPVVCLSAHLEAVAWSLENAAAVLAPSDMEAASAS